MQKIYRGIWADTLKGNDELPVGGSIFSEELTTKLKLDFENINEQIKNYETPKKIFEAYKNNEKEIQEWMKTYNTKIDPLLYFTLNNVQLKTQEILKTNNKTKIDPIKRFEIYRKENAKLTDLIGNAMCAEHAALGQYLLQNTLPEKCSSAYMSGVFANEKLNYLLDHSFIVLNDANNETYIFDIANPMPTTNLPVVYKTNIDFNKDLFKKTNNRLVEAREIFEKKVKKYFGVGHEQIDRTPNIINYPNNA